MNNVYRDVQSVVARVRGAGGRARGRTALLLNCHFDTVPDSPGNYAPRPSTPPHHSTNLYFFTTFKLV